MGLSPSHYEAQISNLHKVTIIGPIGQLVCHKVPSTAYCNPFKQLEDHGYVKCPVLTADLLVHSLPSHCQFFDAATSATEELKAPVFRCHLAGKRCMFQCESFWILYLYLMHYIDRLPECFTKNICFNVSWLRTELPIQSWSSCLGYSGFPYFSHPGNHGVPRLFLGGLEYSPNMVLKIQTTSCKPKVNTCLASLWQLVERSRQKS